MSKRKVFPSLVFLLFLIPLAACSERQQPTAIPALPAAISATTDSTLPAETPETTTLTPGFDLTQTVTPEPTKTSTAAVTHTPAEPVGCLEPPDDITRVELPYATLNARTLAMLQHAQSLYAGEIDILGAITQGSYTDAETASFGTHSGGGAVDLSVMRAGTYTVLRDEIEPLVHALRLAGFAAWLRDLDGLYPGSPIHIHAVAVGDRELSYAAQLQVYGDYGYFAGMDGLPPLTGEAPEPDQHGGPVICAWMRAYLEE